MVCAEPPASADAPTAMQAVSELHETEDRPLLSAAVWPGGLDTTLQLDPSQCSVSSAWAKKPTWDAPTAQHDVADAHETEVNPPSVGSPLRSSSCGVLCAVQAVPSQRSATGPFSSAPTAVHVSV